MALEEPLEDRRVVALGDLALVGLGQDAGPDRGVDRLGNCSSIIRVKSQTGGRDG